MYNIHIISSVIVYPNCLFHSQLNQVKGELWIELLTSSQQSLLGLAHLKLYTIRHSNNVSVPPAVKSVCTV